ncbi:unnamed protein product, partial [Timema podura]|nr:unnamed protein product [Timema podura]
LLIVALWTVLQAEGAYKAQVGQLQAQLHEQLNVNASLAVQLRDAQLERDGITQQLAHLQEVAVRAEEITRQLEESNHARSEVEHQLTALQHHDYEKTKEIQAERLRLGSDLEQLQAQVQRLREDKEHLTHQVSSLSGLEDEVSQLREENESLAAQVTAVTERPAAEGRENGDLHYPEEDKAAFINHDTVVKQKDSLIESLTSELNIHKTETSRLSEELDVQREKNNQKRVKHRLEYGSVARDVPTTPVPPATDSPPFHNSTESPGKGIKIKCGLEFLASSSTRSGN